MGWAGDDWLTTDNGPDLLIGNDGDDKLFSGRLNDVLKGGRGDDKLFGGPGRHYRDTCVDRVGMNVFEECEVVIDSKSTTGLRGGLGGLEFTGTPT